MKQQFITLTQEQFQELLGARNGGNDGPSKAATPMRPTIDIDTSEGEWAVFEDQWERYKRMAKVTAIADVRDNLRQCCASLLNKRLFDVKGAATLNAATEQDLLLWIRVTAVKGVHKEVHRTQFVLEKSDASLSSLGNNEAYANYSGTGNERKGGDKWRKRRAKKEKDTKDEKESDDGRYTHPAGGK